jgi:hypothetical protein
MGWKTSKKQKSKKAKSAPTLAAKLSKKDQQFKHEIELLKASVNKAFETHRRFWFYSALEIAYTLYHGWRADRHSKKNAKKAARLFGVKIKDGAHPLTAIIKVLTPPGVDTRRWVNGLRFARKQGVAPKDLLAFLKANGSIAGCARKFDPAE